MTWVTDIRDKDKVDAVKFGGRTVKLKRTTYHEVYGVHGMAWCGSVCGRVE